MCPQDIIATAIIRITKVLEVEQSPFDLPCHNTEGSPVYQNPGPLPGLYCL
jgi:hypothetical protein